MDNYTKRDAGAEAQARALFDRVESADVLAGGDAIGRLVRAARINGECGLHRCPQALEVCRSLTKV
jgi:hypothetical protein